MIDRHLLHLHELRRDVDRDVALALRVARVGDELAAVDHAARVVDVAERHLDRLGAGLAVFAGRAGQLHDHADRDVAIRRLADAGRGHQQGRKAATANANVLMIYSLNFPAGTLTLSIFGILHPGFLQVAPDDAARRRRLGREQALSTAAGSSCRHDTVARCIRARPHLLSSQTARGSEISMRKSAARCRARLDASEDGVAVVALAVGRDHRRNPGAKAASHRGKIATDRAAEAARRRTHAARRPPRARSASGEIAHEACLLEIVLHDRAVPAGAVALERRTYRLRGPCAWRARRRSRHGRRRSGASSVIARLAARWLRLRAPTMTAATCGRSSMARLATVAMSVPWRSAMRRSACSKLETAPSRRNRR